MSTAIYFIGVILAAALLGRMLKQRNRSIELNRDREYFKRHYARDSK